MPLPTDVAKMPPAPAAATTAFRRWIAAYQARHPDADTRNVHLAEQMHINETSWSQIRRGKRRPLIGQCLAIARQLEIPLEDVLRLEGFPDIKQLAQIVGQEPPPQTKEAREVRQYAIDLLHIAAQSPLWQGINQQSPYKERADEILASDMPPLEKAVRYADVIYDWYQNRERDTPRWQRKTDEIAALVGNAS